MEKTPNGRVSNAQLYKALYELDKSLGERFTALDNTFTAVHNRIDNVEDRQQLHEESDHQAGASTTKLGGVAGLVAAIVAGVALAIRQVFG